MRKLKIKRSYPMHCLFRLNVGGVEMMPFMSYITNIISILWHKIFNRKLKINSTSFRRCNVEYIITQKEHKCRNQKCDFHLSTPFEWSCLTRNTICHARNILQI